MAVPVSPCVPVVGQRRRRPSERELAPPARGPAAPGARGARIGPACPGSRGRVATGRPPPFLLLPPPSRPGLAASAGGHPGAAAAAQEEGERCRLSTAARAPRTPPPPSKKNPTLLPIHARFIPHSLSLCLLSTSLLSPVSCSHHHRPLHMLLLRPTARSALMRAFCACETTLPR